MALLDTIKSYYKPTLGLLLTAGLITSFFVIPAVTTFATPYLSPAMAWLGGLFAGLGEASIYASIATVTVGLTAAVTSATWAVLRGLESVVNLCCGEENDDNKKDAAAKVQAAAVVVAGKTTELNNGTATPAAPVANTNAKSLAKPFVGNVLVPAAKAEKAAIVLSDEQAKQLAADTGLGASRANV